jgi:hypothetical protein
MRMSHPCDKENGPPPSGAVINLAQMPYMAIRRRASVRRLAVS